MKTIQARLAAMDPRGEPLPLVTGRETLEELRNLIVEFSLAGAAGQIDLPSPFKMLSGLSYASLTTLVRNMPRETCLDLFEQELKSRAEAGAQWRPAAKKRRLSPLPARWR